MSRVPVVTSPCPLRWTGSPKPGMDYCGVCERRVHNLDLMSQQQREDFLAGCSGNVCVTYSVRRAARASLALGVGLVVLAGAGSAGETTPEAGAYCDVPDLMEVIVGGTEAGEKLQWLDESEINAPAKEVLPDIEAASWLPPPKT